MPRVRDPDFCPDNIPKKKIVEDADWKKLCPFCESLMMETGKKWKCSCCGHSAPVKKSGA